MLEFLGIMPFILIVILLIVQIIFFGFTAVSSVGAAHSGARSAALSGCGAAVATVERASERWSDEAREVSCVCGSDCEVSVALRMPPVLWGVGDVWFPSSTVMRAER